MIKIYKIHKGELVSTNARKINNLLIVDLPCKEFGMEPEFKRKDVSLTKREAILKHVDSATEDYIQKVKDVKTAHDNYHSAICLENLFLNE